MLAFLSNNINRYHLAALYLGLCNGSVNFYSQNCDFKSQKCFWVANYIVATILSYVYPLSPSLLFSSTVQLILQNLPLFSSLPQFSWYCKTFLSSLLFHSSADTSSLLFSSTVQLILQNLSSLLFSSTVQLILQNLPEVYLEKLLTFLADCLDNSPHLQFYLHWCTQLLTTHGDKLKENFSSIMTAVRDLQKSILQKQADIGKM